MGQDPDNAKGKRDPVPKEAVSDNEKERSKTPPNTCETAKSSSSSLDTSQPQKTISLEGLASFLKTSFLPGEKVEQAKEATEEIVNKKEMKILRPVITLVPLSDITKFCISLSGCGFLGSYHFGAITCLTKNGRPVTSKLHRVSGASAGSLVASVFLLCPEKIDTCLNILYNMADELNTLKFGALTQGYFLNEKLVKIVEEQIPNNISPAKNKLFVSVTDYKTRENVLLSDFSDKNELIQALMASCFIPMYSMGYKGIPPKINGKYYIDGGYSNNLPDFEDVRTITISPFSGGADISPTDEMLFEWQMRLGSQQMNVNMQNLVRGAQALFPPRREILKDYYARGYKDTYRFLLKHNLLERNSGSSV